MLTDQECRAAKGEDKPYKLRDSRGLYLFVTSAGFRSWRWKYRFGGKEKLLTFGPYPKISLKQARSLRDQAALVLGDGRDPGLERRRGQESDEAAPRTTFREVAERWLADQAEIWTPAHAAQVRASFISDIYPAIGDEPIAAMKPAKVKELLLAIQKRGAIDTAHRVRGRISSVFGYAIADELAEVDPAAGLAKRLKPVREGFMPALTKLEEARTFLAAVEAQAGQPAVKLASRLLALTAVRPGVIRFAAPAEFEDLETDAPFWRIPAAKMKLALREKEQEAFEFLVPLSRQAADVVRTAMQHAGRSPFLFPGLRLMHRPISENALSYAYKRVDVFQGKHVPHGWRSTFSTIMNERALEQQRAGDRAIIDLMLAHQPEGVESRYNRAAYMPRRRQIAQEWADLLMYGFKPARYLLHGPRH